MLATTLLTLTIAVLLPLVGLATVLLLPFCDRPTQVLQLTTYLTLVGVVVHL